MTISGPTAGIVNTAHTFTVTVSPPTATTPISYPGREASASPAPGSGQGMPNASYTWTTEGVKTVTVTAANAGGAVSDTHVITIAGLTVRVITYEYDALGRLVEAGYSSGERFEYRYDEVGNRLRYTQTITGTTVITYGYDAANRLTNVNGVPYTWDNTGNLKNDGTNTYTYTQANRLVAISGPGLEWSAVYNGDGARLRQTANGSVTTYTLDLAAPLVTVLAQQDANGTKHYVYARGTRPLAQGEAGVWVYLLSDGLGSVRHEADAAGNVLATRAFDPFGVPLESDGGAPYGYTGEQYDASTELLFLRARYYDPVTGRFTQQDPSGLERNLYAYVASNPVNRIDPSGLFSLRAIAKSYGYSDPDDIEDFLDYFASQGRSWGPAGPKWPRWGWLGTLLAAKDNDMIRVGTPGLWLPYLDETNNYPIRCAEDGKIRIGPYDLKQYANDKLENPMNLAIWWRNTKPTYYILTPQSREWWITDHDRPRDLPDFRVINWDAFATFFPGAGQILAGGASAIIDRWGRPYYAFFGGGNPNLSLPVSVGEGYVGYSVNEVTDFDARKIPNKTEVKGAITGWCVNATALVGTSEFTVSYCKNGAFVSMYGYGAGGALGLTLSWGDQLPPERTGLPQWQIDGLAWDYIDYEAGFTRADVERMLENEIQQCNKCGQ